MMTLRGKNLNFVKYLLGILGLFRILQLLINGQSFLLKDGPLPSFFVYGMSSHTIFKYVPLNVVNCLPYWWGPATVLLVIHLALLVVFILDFKPRIFLCVLILFEYGLYTRTSFVVHAGDSLFLTTLILFFIDDWLPARLRWITPVLWVSQGLLLYFFSGAYKDFNLWFVQGSALQDFSSYYSNLLGENLRDWGSLGVYLSRGTLVIEIGISLTLLMCFLGLLKIQTKLITVLCCFFAFIHVGSALMFSLFTLPWILIGYLLGTILQFNQARDVALIPKLGLFTLVLFFHLFPYLGVSVFPFDLFPLRQQWSLFAKVPPAKQGPVTAELYFNKTASVINKFDETFQWRRYQEYLVEEYPQSRKLRKSYGEFNCKTPDASLLIWRTPHGELQHKCREK